MGIITFWLVNYRREQCVYFLEKKFYTCISYILNIALTLDENITYLSISKANTILAVSEAGILYIFKDITSLLSTDVTPQNKKRKQFTTKKATGQIKILNKDDGGIIPILSACFVDEEENKELDHIM